MTNKTLFCSFYVSFCTFCASLWLIRTVFTRPKTSLPHEIAQRYLFGVISASKNLCNICLKICEICVLSFQPLTSTKEFVRKNKLFLQNEPKFRKVKFDVTEVLTKDYDQLDTWSIRTKQSQTNPNKAKLKKAKINVNRVLTKDYENKSPFWAPKKQSQIPKRKKPMQTSLPKGIMKNTALSASKKQTQFKPKQTQFQRQYMKITGRHNPFAYDSDPNVIDKTNCILSTNCVIISKYTRSNKMQLSENCCPKLNEGVNLCIEMK